MQTTPKTPKTVSASPPLNFQNQEAWKSQKPGIFQQLEKEIYGKLPKTHNAKLIHTRSIPNDFINTNIEEITLRAQYFVREGQPTKQSSQNIEFKVVLITPSQPAARTPVIMMESFCPNHNVIPVAGLSKPENVSFSCDGTRLMHLVAGFFFGRYIKTPPIQNIIDRGYALAVTFPSDVFPDMASAASIYKYAPNPDNRWGAIGAWAWQFSLLSNHLGADPRFSHTIAYGHSRYGKSALLAAAYDETIDSVIAHQSGTGGASLSIDKPGETVELITKNYPHWFTPGYSEDNLSLDQHHLLALLAPRPILLGNAKRDVWSDPEGAFRAARAATPIYKLFGSNGLSQNKLNVFHPEADISFWIRRGTHGVVKEDWPAFLEFLDAHFKDKH